MYFLCSWRTMNNKYGEITIGNRLVPSSWLQVSHLFLGLPTQCKSCWPERTLTLTWERLYRTFAHPGPLSKRGMSHFVVEILPANNTGVKMSVATFKEIYILEKYTRPYWFQLTMQFYELQNSGRLNGILSRRSHVPSNPYEWLDARLTCQLY